MDLRRVHIMHTTTKVTPGSVSVCERGPDEMMFQVHHDALDVLALRRSEIQPHRLLPEVFEVDPYRGS